MSHAARVEEGIFVAASAESVYRAVSNVRRMGEWSPECVGAWSRSQQFEPGTRFIGWNRKRLWFWFTSCTVVRAERPRDFAFTVRTFGMPVALWGYLFEDQNSGCLVTEYWEDLRTGRSAPVAKLLGLVFTGTSAKRRTEVSQEGMRATLSRLKAVTERA